MNLFKNTYDPDKDKRKANNQEALYGPWQATAIISSNCPRHVGVRLERIGDNTYKCPKGHETYKSMASVSNQTNRDRYDQGLIL